MIAPWITFYGDDFTGSTDVLEVLQWAGVPTVLFLSPPSGDLLRKFEGFQAWGLAGHTRSMAPVDMERELDLAFTSLGASQPRIVHYKTCSTFDSSPEIGSIGRAMEVGRERFGTSPIPLLIGAPRLGRYQVFGNLFARSGLDSEPFRLDRHPTMQCHPITPMDEADLRRHLARQTDLRVELCDVLRLDRVRDEPGPPWQKLESWTEADAVLFDVLTPSHLETIGEWLWESSGTRPPCYTVGSSGVEYALIEWLSSPRCRAERRDGAALGLTAGPSGRTFPAVEQLLAVTGSCSPVTARQIEAAERRGFAAMALDPVRLIDPAVAESELIQAADRALKLIETGANVILHTSRGPQDPRIGAVSSHLKSRGLGELAIRRTTGELLGTQLGRLLARILSRRPLPRVGIAGGDTSGYVARGLGLVALEAIAPVAPGSPLCRAHADGPLHGVEFCFKGGQVGRDDIWQTLRHGTETPPDNSRSISPIHVHLTTDRN